MFTVGSNGVAGGFSGNKTQKRVHGSYHSNQQPNTLILHAHQISIHLGHPQQQEEVVHKPQRARRQQIFMLNTGYNNQAHSTSNKFLSNVPSTTGIMNFGNANLVVRQEPTKQDSLTEMAMQRAATLKKNLKNPNNPMQQMTLSGWNLDARKIIAAPFGQSQYLRESGVGISTAGAHEPQSEDEDDYHNVPLSSRAGIGSAGSTDTLIINQGAVPQIMSPKTDRGPLPPPNKKVQANKPQPQFDVGSIITNKSRGQNAFLQTNQMNQTANGQGNKNYAPFMSDDDTPKYFTKPMSPTNGEKPMQVKRQQEKSRNQVKDDKSSRLNQKSSQMTESQMPFFSSAQFQDSNHHYFDFKNEYDRLKMYESVDQQQQRRLLNPNSDHIPHGLPNITMSHFNTPQSQYSLKPMNYPVEEEQLSKTKQQGKKMSINQAQTLKRTMYLQVPSTNIVSRGVSPMVRTASQSPTVIQLQYDGPNLQQTLMNQTKASGSPFKKKELDEQESSIMNKKERSSQEVQLINDAQSNYQPQPTHFARYLNQQNYSFSGGTLRTLLAAPQQLNTSRAGGLKASFLNQSFESSNQKHNTSYHKKPTQKGGGGMKVSPSPENRTNMFKAQSTAHFAQGDEFTELFMSRAKQLNIQRSAKYVLPLKTKGDPKLKKAVADLTKKLQSFKIVDQIIQSPQSMVSARSINHHLSEKSVFLSSYSTRDKMENNPRISKDLSRVFSKLKLEQDSIVELRDQDQNRDASGRFNDSQMLPAVHLSPAPLYLRAPVRSHGGNPQTAQQFQQHKSILSKKQSPIYKQSSMVVSQQDQRNQGIDGLISIKKSVFEINPKVSHPTMQNSLIIGNHAHQMFI